MSIGLPGTGVGGLFYLLSGLFMPFREGYRALWRASDRRSRRLVTRQAGITLGVLVGIWATGWLLGLVLSHAPAFVAMATGGHAPSGRAANVLRIASLSLAFATLAAVLGAVEVARLGRAWGADRDQPQRDPSPSRAERDAA